MDRTSMIIMLSLLGGSFFIIALILLDAHIRKSRSSHYHSEKMQDEVWKKEGLWYVIRMFFKYKLIYPIANVWNRSRLSCLTNWKNYRLCKKYPFMTCYFNKFQGYKWIPYNDMPTGWQKAFGIQMLDEIKATLIKHKMPLRTSIIWEQIKSKYGGLRLYATAPKCVQDILAKYEVLSYGYCEFCGAPARYMTHGWIAYLCEDCFEKDLGQFSMSLKQIDKAKKECRLTKDDILESTLYYRHKKDLMKAIKEGEVRKEWEKKIKKDKDGGYEIKLSPKEEYGIDFEELWGIKE